ncbi:MAG: ATP-binding cassette domain-containing protein [Desulfobacterales bacterium]|nr:ATP-binding cassette domain-containing protein [Desulfobacterales bacterium]
MASSASMQLSCRQATFRYPRTATPVFEDLSFEMPGPGFNALFGPSGVGKTTLARLLTGTSRDFAGEIRMDGIDRVLYTYNTERLPGWSAVGTHLERIVAPGQHDLRDRLVALFDMQPHLASRFAQLSLGQKNRINLIRYLLQDFQMLIMDESLANVDEPTREQIILGIKDLFPDRFFLYISHNVVEVAKFCRHILVLAAKGRARPASVVSGRDHNRDGTPDRERLERAMLEIVNAA